MKEDEVENILNNCNLIAFTEKTITSIERIRVELKKIRKTGFSFYDREYDKYLRAIGAPIIGKGSKVKGAVVLITPFQRIRSKELSFYGNLVKETGCKISRETGGQV